MKKFPGSFFYPHYPHELKVIHNIQNPQKSIYFCKKRKNTKKIHEKSYPHPKKCKKM